LRAVEGKPGVPDRWKQLPEDASGLLIEFREPSVERLNEVEQVTRKVLASLNLQEPADFTRDPQIAAEYWAVRSGLLTSIGGARKSGTSVILEDVCFPIDRLAEGAVDLQRIFAKHGYDGAVFGHASVGNLHFLLTPSFNTPAEIKQFDDFLREVVAVVVEKYDGSLKAEHGTGRNIAPFVASEWGGKLTEMMWRVKNLADPAGILAPGVLLSRDAEAHIHNLHTVPTVEKEIDRCIECGFCEPVCPSRNITTTPRQRIVLRREMLRQPEGSAVARALMAEYNYDAIETCAGDGSCAIACPVDINTGTLMKEFRH
jgi:D-lactate dehydrogenase